MTRVPASQARERLADILNEVAYGGQRVVLHRRGKNVAAVISIDDLKRLEALENAADVAAAVAARAEGSSTPWEQVKKDLDL